MEDTLSLSLDQLLSSKCVVSLNHGLPAQLGRSYQRCYQALTPFQCTNGYDALYMFISSTPSGQPRVNRVDAGTDERTLGCFFVTWRKSRTMVTNENLHLPRTTPGACFSLSLERPFLSCCQLLTTVTITKSTQRNGISQVSNCMSVVQFWNIELQVLQDSNCFAANSSRKTIYAVEAAFSISLIAALFSLFRKDKCLII
jgi:hypothetical protein